MNINRSVSLSISNMSDSSAKTTAEALFNTLDKDVLSELVTLATPISKIPWLFTVKGIFAMLGHDTWRSYNESLFGFIGEFEQFCHEVESFDDIPKDIIENNMPYLYRSPDSKVKLYIDVSQNKDPEINAKMFLYFNKFIPLFIRVNGTDETDIPKPCSYEL